MTNGITDKPYGWAWEWADGQTRFVRGEVSPGKEFVPLYCGKYVEQLRETLNNLTRLNLQDGECERCGNPIPKHYPGCVVQVALRVLGLPDNFPDEPSEKA